MWPQVYPLSPPKLPQTGPTWILLVVSVRGGHTSLGLRIQLLGRRFSDCLQDLWGHLMHSGMVSIWLLIMRMKRGWFWTLIRCSFSKNIYFMFWVFTLNSMYWKSHCQTCEVFTISIILPGFQGYNVVHHTEGSPEIPPHKNMPTHVVYLVTWTWIAGKL